MKERPILFSAPMVTALLEGRKTQTRRVVRHDRVALIGLDHVAYAARLAPRVPAAPIRFPEDLCPHGVPGDRLWVRETFAPASREHHSVADYPADGRPRDAGNYWAWYASTDDMEGRWTPSIFMPRWASRITLEITEVRVQRLQELSEDDARAEGVSPGDAGDADLGGTARGAFHRLWDSINGKPRPMLDDDGEPVRDDGSPIMVASRAWASNPLVWAISFRVVR